MKSRLGRGLDSLLRAYDEETETKANLKPAKAERAEKPEKPELEKVAGQKEKAEQKGVAADGIETIDINKIYANPNQPRKKFDKESLNELAESIKVHGLIQPIIVNKMPDGYMIIAGERRFRACKLAGVSKVDAVVKNYSQKQVAEISIIENLQREDLNPVELAKGIKRLMDEFGLTQEKVADRLGKSRPAVANTLRILSLYPEVLELVENGKVSFGHAKILASVTDYANQLLLAKKVAKDKLTVRDLELEVQALLGGKKKAKQVKQPSHELLDFVNNLQRKLGTKVSLIGNDKKGRIYIDYYSQDDLDRIYDIVLR